MSEANMFPVLRAFVDAYVQPHPNGGREPIYLFRHLGGHTIEHHALPEPPDVDEGLLNEMMYQGLIDLDYIQHGFKITPTPKGREAIKNHDRVTNEAPLADTGAVVEAVAAQARASNKLGWPAVRPVLSAIRDYWEASGFPRHGIPLIPLGVAVAEENRALFAVTIRALVEGDYLRDTTALRAPEYDLPAEVALTERAHTVLSGWPGASPRDLAENLAAVLVEELDSETDPARKRRLAKLLETLRDVGTNTAGDILARVLMGGG